MIFIALMFATASAVAAAAAFFSVYGLAHTFSGAFWSVVFMGGSVEAGKLILLSFLYRFKDTVGWAIKIPAIALTLAIMMLTSLGIYGYLSAAYQADTVGMKQMTANVDLKKQEQLNLQKRKDDIDKQISQLPTKDVRGRQKLMTQFGPEITQVNSRLNEVTTELQKLAQEQIVSDAHVGPIVFIAKAMGADPDSATNILILLIIFVFDPLAIFLTIATNIAIKEYHDKKAIKQDLPVFTPAPEINHIVQPVMEVEPVIEPQIDDSNSIAVAIDPVIEPQIDDSIAVAVDPEPLVEFLPEPTVTKTDDSSNRLDEIATSLSTLSCDDVQLEPDIADHTPPIDTIVKMYDEIDKNPVKSDIDAETLDMIQKFFARRNLMEKVRSGKVD